MPGVCRIQVKFSEGTSQKIMWSDLTEMNSSAVVEISVSGLPQAIAYLTPGPLWSMVGQHQTVFFFFYRRYWREQMPEPNTGKVTSIHILFIVAFLFIWVLIWHLTGQWSLPCTQINAGMASALDWLYSKSYFKLVKWSLTKLRKKQRHDKIQVCQTDVDIH